MHSNLWLSLIVLCSLISGYYTQTHFVSDEDDDSYATIRPTASSKGIEDKDGYCFFEEK